MLWVYLTWIPSFFADEYDLKLAKFALFTTLVLIAGVVGDTVGGLLSDGLMRRTGNLRFARRTCWSSACSAPSLWILPTLFVKDLVAGHDLPGASFFFLELCNSVLWAIPMDIAPRHAGTAGGLMNTGFGVAGILSPVTFGFLLDQTGSWLVPFGLSGRAALHRRDARAAGQPATHRRGPGIHRPRGVAHQVEHQEPERGAHRTCGGRLVVLALARQTFGG